MLKEKTFSFILNPWANGGEQFILKTTIASSEDEEFITQQIVCNSYANQVNINIQHLFDVATLEKLLDHMKLVEVLFNND